MLQFKNIEKRFGHIVALSNVTLDVEQGCVLALLGPNGAGKSTLFGCLLGLIFPTAGEVLLREQNVRDCDRRSFGYVPERISLYPQRTVWENGLFFAKLRGHGEHELETQLKRVGLYNVHDRKVRQLSKGMLQRLGLAIALCGQPKLLVLDEPFNGLDPVLLEQLQNILRAEKERGATLLISTHTISAVENLATHVAILLQGQVAASGTLVELRAKYPDHVSLENIYHTIARQSRNTAPEEIAA
ncbi:MAG: ABC transporter ATP-binding protein [Limisphaerales bacterium]